MLLRQAFAGAANFERSDAGYMATASSVGNLAGAAVLGANGKLLTFAGWIYPTSADLTGLMLGSADGTKYEVELNAGKVELFGRNTGDTVILNATTDNVVITQDIWNHVYASFDLSDSGKRKMYINGVAAAMTWTTYTDDSLWFAKSGGFHLMKNLPCRAADVWMDFSYNDIVDKFVRNGKALPLGADGSTPTGSQAEMFYSSTTNESDWKTDKGSASHDVTENSSWTFTATDGPGV